MPLRSSSVSKTLDISELRLVVKRCVCLCSLVQLAPRTRKRMPAVASVRPCPACTFHNLPSATHCDVCDEPLAAPAPALVTPAKSMDGVKVKTEGVTVKPEAADGATPSVVKAEVNTEVKAEDEDEEEPALVCVPRTAPKKKQAPAPAPAPAAPAPAPQADDDEDEEEPEICRPRTAPVADEDEKVAMKKQSGYQFHNSQHRETVKKEIEAENPDLPAKEKNALITKRLGDMWKRLDSAAQHRYKADAPYVVVKQKGPHKAEPPRLVDLPAGTHGKCKKCGEGVENRAVVVGSRRWKVACFREATSLDVGDGSHKCKVSGEMIESGAVCLAVKVKSATIYFEASKVAPFLRALLKPALPDALFGGFDALGGPQKQAFYALFPDVALPEKYMSKGQKASSKVAQLPDFAAIVGRPRDTRYDIDDDDSEEDEDEEPVPAPKKRRVIEDLEDDA